MEPRMAGSEAEMRRIRLLSVITAPLVFRSMPVAFTTLVDVRVESLDIRFAIREPLDLSSAYS
jgi:hypothetical protein